MRINQGWTVETVGQEESTRKVVDLPYDAMLRESRSAENPGGTRISSFAGRDYRYRKTLLLPPDVKDKEVYLEFEGIYKDPKIQVNGIDFPVDPYGFNDILIDVTKAVKPGENEIVVLAHNSDQPNTRFYSGSGIYRDVHLYLKDRIHVLPHTLRVTTLDIQKGTIRIEGKLSEPSAFTYTIYDAENPVLIKDVEKGKADFSFETEVPTFHLWSPDHPYLYTLEVKLPDDVEKVRFGIRKLTLDEKKGFLINGERVILYGACIHSDNGMLGAETSRFIEYRKARSIKERGYNAIRSAHNPMCRDFLDACDEIGLLVMDEYSDCWFIPKTKYDYANHCLQYYPDDLRKMVEKDYNHPSVIFYSIGNEVSETAFPKGIQLVSKMVDILHEEDPTRFVTCGVNVFFNGISHTPFSTYSEGKAEKDEKKEAAGRKKEEEGKKKSSSDFFNQLGAKLGVKFISKGAKTHLVDKYTKGTFAKLDIAGYNYGILRYEKDLKKYPHRFILGTETFVVDSGRFEKLVKKHPRILGDFVWTALDYLGEAGFNAWVNAHDYPYEKDPSGWLTDGGGRIDLCNDELSEMDFTRVCFEQQAIGLGVVSPYDYRYKHSPAGWKLSRALNVYNFPGEEGSKTVAEVYSSADKVVLLQNGKKVKTLHPARHQNLARAKIRYVPGELEAIAYGKDGKVTASLKRNSGGKFERLVLKPEEEEIPVDGLCFLHLYATDASGNLDPLTPVLVESVKTDNGSVIRLGNAAPYNKEGYFLSHTPLYYGKAMAIVKPDHAGFLNLLVRTKDGHEARTQVKVLPASIEPEREYLPLTGSFESKENSFLYLEEGKALAHIDYEEDGSALTIVKTEVDPSLKGRGVGKSLVSLVKAKAKEEGKVLKATCSFASRLLKKN